MIPLDHHFTTLPDLFQHAVKIKREFGFGHVQRHIFDDTSLFLFRISPGDGQKELRTNPLSEPEAARPQWPRPFHRRQPTPEWALPPLHGAAQPRNRAYVLRA